jgi:hypothetical protein
MSRWPFPWQYGEPQSLRATLYNALILPARVGAQIGIVSDQVVALAKGQDVVFPTAQLRSFFPRGDEHPALPPSLDAADAWVLSDDNTLTASP